MNRYEIHLSDLSRILFGQAPPLFLLEVFVRALVTYLLLLIIVRWLGKRMTGELTIMEMAVMVTLGAIVSTPMQVPERGVLQGLVLLLCALGFQRGISYLGYRSHKFENITQGRPCLMVKDGVMQLGNMRDDRISRDQLLAALRQQGIYNLGLAERVYLEAAGAFSVYRFSNRHPGLSLFPANDDVIGQAGQNDVSISNTHKACCNCGCAIANHEGNVCPVCHQTEFKAAVL